MIEDLVKLLLSRGIVFPRNTIGGYMEWSLIRDVITSLEINCVLDVGANIGRYAKNLRKIGYRGHILSFEPVREAFISMSKSFEQDPSWKGYNFALGSENTTQAINVPVGSTIYSSFLSPTNFNCEIREELVEVKRLDTIIDDLLQTIKNPRLFVKMDTQGYDVEVIKGSEGCIDRILGIQSEVAVQHIYRGMPHYLDALRLYEQLGFRLVGLSEVARNPQLGSIVELNCVLARSQVFVHWQEG